MKAIYQVRNLRTLALALLAGLAPLHASAGACGQGMASLEPHVSTKNGAVNMHVLQGLVHKASQIAVNPQTRRYNNGHVVITDGCRSVQRNRNTRGSDKNSAHLRGHALDIRANQTSPQAYAMAVKSAGLAQGGYYNTCRPHVHIDTEHQGFRNECGGKGKYKRRGGNGRHRYRANSGGQGGNPFSRLFGL